MTQEFCRFCLKTFDLKPIFLDVSENERYSVVLEITTGLKVTLNDGFPQMLCSECTENINLNLNFRNECQQSELELIRIGFKKTSQIYQEDIEKGEYPQESVIQGEYTKQEPVNQSEYSEQEPGNQAEYLIKDECIDIEVPELEINVDLQRLTQDISIDDSICNSSASEAKEVLSETNKVNNESEGKVVTRKERRKELLNLVEGSFEKNGPVKCKVCKKILKSWRSFVSHAKLHLGFKFVCEFCGKSFISSTQLKRHCRSHHGMKRSLRCTFCDYMALDNTQLTLHIRRIHSGVRPFTCNVCGSSYFSRRCLIQHLESHQDRHVVQCNTCGGLFKSSRHLSRHTYVVHTRKLYKYRCVICARVYASPKYARVHINRYHGRPPTEGDVEKIHV